MVGLKKKSMLENSIRENARYFGSRDLVIFGYFCDYFYRYFCMRRIFLLRCVFPTRFLATRFLAIFLLIFSLLVSLVFMGACAKRGSVSSKHKYSRESCPSIFVAESFSTKSILDELHSTTHRLTFTKVKAFCKRDKQGLLLLDLSFNFLLEPVLSKGAKVTTKGAKGTKGSARRQRLFLPLFAIASEDEKTIFSRTDKSLEVRFNSSGRANARWLLALPSSSSSLSEISSSSNFSLYLGFSGSDELFPLRSLLEERG